MLSNIKQEIYPQMTLIRNHFNYNTKKEILSEINSLKSLYWVKKKREEYDITGFIYKKK